MKKKLKIKLKKNWKQNSNNQIWKKKKTFKIKIGYYLERLIPDTMKLLESTENKITKDKNGKNVPHLGITELVLVHCNIFNNDY